MTKLAVLITRRPDGSLYAVPGESLDPLLTAAKKARVSGVLNGKPITEGVVMATWKHGVVFKFRHVKPELPAVIEKANA